MDRYLTRTLNLANYLARIYTTRGKETFLEELRRQFNFIQEQFAEQNETFNKHLETLVMGIIAEFSDNRPEIAIRKRAQIGDMFLSEKEPAKKLEFLTGAFLKFIDDFEAERETERLAEQVLKHLKTCSLNVLRLVSLETLADTFGYSKNYFAERFKSERQMTVLDAITQEKMNRAFQMLSREADRHTVKDISALLGFSDPVYFSRLFRKKYGMLPSKVSKT